MAHAANILNLLRTFPCQLCGGPVGDAQGLKLCHACLDRPPMKRIFVCSPLRGDYEANLARAREYCRQIMDEGHLPFAPHVTYTQWLDDTDPRQRAKGIAMGLVELARCDELHFFGEPTEGMALEIRYANHLGIPVVCRLS